MAFAGGTCDERYRREDPLLSEFNIYMLNRNNEFDSSKAERELGFRCRPFSESIRDTVEWLREEGYVDVASKAEVVDINLPGVGPFFMGDFLSIRQRLQEL